ncbi:hypothetical protein EYF80_040649 [Liparis tanakae]|uniref:Uncharacterized protein n=1 Tax=Liparis tanakae TaxID=230148 RepID=A0A4Z2G7D5_9TELE|nr:hypothetical protein EYF80_040649 [Liparis tanakae]
MSASRRPPRFYVGGLRALEFVLCSFVLAEQKLKSTCNRQAAENRKKRVRLRSYLLSTKLEEEEAVLRALPAPPPPPEWGSSSRLSPRGGDLTGPALADKEERRRSTTEPHNANANINLYGLYRDGYPLGVH